MKLHLLERGNLHNSSFTNKVDDYPYLLKKWHYHIELELVLILKSEGSCFVGDSIEKFEVGDIILIGENLPHMWLNDEDYFQQNADQTSKAIVIHFKKDYLGTSFFETPEMNHIWNLFNRARLGLKFLNTNPQLIEIIQDLSKQSGFEKTMSFINILNQLAKHKETKSLASEGFVNSFKPIKNETQDKVHAYIFKNFNKDIPLEEVAQIAHMNASAFSRFFKRINNKTFSRYLSEIRIGYACKLLLEEKYTIATICYESGFNNISNFNRQFKLIMNSTPSVYLRKHQNDNL